MADKIVSAGIYGDFGEEEHGFPAETDQGEEAILATKQIQPGQDDGLILLFLARMPLI
jgi:hypothetical protein